jgi:hypothetical protein
MRAWLALAVAFLASLTPAGARAAAGPFADWAAIVVAGDFHAAHTNNPTETFDNARRDVAAALVRKGFQVANVRQFSVRPDRYPDTRPLKTEARTIYETLKDLTTRTHSGCLIYFTSHGAPSGVLLGDQMLPPGIMDQLISQTCGRRPTVVIISACFSGVFVPVLQDTNRLILTAARPDRSSFGCSEADKYPYFDDCVLRALPSAHDFVGLAPAVQGCVARRENEEGLRPPSEPQVSVGPGLRPILPLMAFPPG